VSGKKLVFINFEIKACLKPESFKFSKIIELKSGFIKIIFYIQSLFLWILSFIQTVKSF